MALEGSVENPKLPEIFVVNDYITSWMASVAAVAAQLVTDYAGATRVIVEKWQYVLVLLIAVISGLSTELGRVTPRLVVPP